jgi:hypothetical protein
MYSAKVYGIMEEVTITLPKAIAASLLDFVNQNMQVQGKDGANALLLIISAFETSLSSTTPSDEADLPLDEEF